jgi:hypothetical protein
VANVFIQAAFLISGQLLSQSSGNISCLVTSPPVAASIAAPCLCGIGRLPSAQRDTSGACAPMHFAKAAVLPRSSANYSESVMALTIANCYMKINSNLHIYLYLAIC